MDHQDHSQLLHDEHNHHHHHLEDPESFSKKQRIEESDEVLVDFKQEDNAIDIATGDKTIPPYGIDIDSHSVINGVDHSIITEAQMMNYSSQLPNNIIPLYHTHPNSPLSSINKNNKRKRSSNGIETSPSTSKEMKGKFSQEESNLVRQVVEDAFKARGKDPRTHFQESMHKQKKEEFKDFWLEVASQVNGRDKHQVIRHAQILFGKPSGKIDWTEGLVKRLLQLCEQYTNQWYKIAEEINIPATQCRDKWRILQRSSSKKHLLNLSTQQQHSLDMLADGSQELISEETLMQHGQHMETKRPKSTWTEEEMIRLKALIKKHAAANEGAKLPWVAISKEHGTKDDHQCESKFRRLIPKCDSTKAAVAYVSDIEWPDNNDFALLMYLKKEGLNYESEIDFAYLALYISKEQKISDPHLPERLAVEARMAWQAMKNIVGPSTNRKPIQELLRDIADHYKFLKEFEEQV